MHARYAISLAVGMSLLTSAAALAQEAAERSPAGKRSYRKEYADFLAKPPTVRDHLRQMDRTLHDQDSETQLRLMRLMQRYSDWLDALSAEQRQHVTSAQTTEERLARIAEVREDQWLSTLPKADRGRIADAKKKSPGEYKKAIDEVKQEIQAREMDWLTAQAEMTSQAETFRGMVMRLRNQVRQKLDTDTERSEFDKELQGQPFWNQLKILVPKAEKKGLKVPPNLKNFPIPPDPPLMVERSKLVQFLNKPENEALAKDFWSRFKSDPTKAMFELEQKYWEANPAERKTRDEHDRRIRRTRDKGP